MDNIDLTSIITTTAKDFTRKRTSKILDYLQDNPQAVVMTELNKARGASVKFYHLNSDGNLTSCEYVKHNADTLLKAFKNNGITVKDSKDL